MLYTIVPILQEQPLTIGKEYLPLDGGEGEAWKKAIQAIHPRLLPQLKESALIEEEESAFCVAGGIFEYERGQELVIDGVQYTLSHCAEHFMDFLMDPAQCLQVVQEHRSAFASATVTDEQQARLALVCSWWESGYRVLLLQHS
ncbi:MAG: hypothetical protein ACXVDB_09325 [Tumebacillaceae bacterium]